MVRMGIVTPSEDGRSSSRPYIAGKRSRRLHLTNSLWDINGDPEERAVPPNPTDEAPLQASGEQDHSLGPLSQAENSGPRERSHENTIANSSTGHFAENIPAGTAVPAKKDTQYTVHTSDGGPNMEEDRSVQSVPVNETEHIVEITDEDIQNFHAARKILLARGQGNPSGSGTFTNGDVISNMQAIIDNPTRLASQVARLRKGFSSLLQGKKKGSTQQGNVQISQVQDQWDI